MSQLKEETLFSVDIESSGPIPGIYSLLSLGACVIAENQEDSKVTFSKLFKPISNEADPKALEISGFSLEELEKTGADPEEALKEFSDWIAHSAEDTRPVFVGFNASFDWSFVNYYFHRYLGYNPFGFAALDIKSYFMGATKCSWHDTRSSAMSKFLQPTKRGNHDALEDAIAQAELFQLSRGIPR